jgi:LCP family protein required for cell wall assembly
MKRPNIRQILLIFLSFLILLTVYFSIHSPLATDIIHQKRINILLIGTDYVDYAQHSDTIIFVSYNPRLRFIDLVSIPRDTKVILPDIKQRRINEIYAYYYKREKNHYNASTALMKIVNNIFDNKIEHKYFFQIDYDTFCKFIDILGNVKIDIDEPMHYDDNAGKLHIHFTTGTWLLDGKKALEYVRYRSSAGDIGRIYRTQRFIRALIKKINNPLVIFKLPKLTNLILKRLNTNMSVWDILNLMIELRYINIENVRMAQLPGKPSGAMWEIDEQGLEHVIYTIIGSEIEPITNVRQVTVEVLNASSINGVALEVTRKLRDNNFDVIDWRNYPTRQKKTIVIDRVGDLRSVQKIARILNTEEIFTRYLQDSSVDISVIIGEDYRDKNNIPMEVKFDGKNIR